jgi:hypothetical protein
MTDDREAAEPGPHTWDEFEHEAHLGEFAEELRLLVETVLERVEPVLRRAAADGRTEWGGCSWCPVCAAAALARGEHHDVVAAIAGHGTAIVTVLREALAGMPVEPVMPTDATAPDRSGDADFGPGAGDSGGHQETGDLSGDRPGSGGAPSGRASRPGAGEHAAASRGSKPRYVSIPVQIKS